MKKVIFLIACFSIAIFAQNEQQAPQEQPQQIQQEQSVSLPQPPPEQHHQPAPQQQPPEQSVNLEQRAKVQRLIKKGIAENKEEIQKEALSLSFKDKQYLYKRNRIWAVPYSILNFVPGFGMGSYIQGNTGFGLVQSALDIGGGLILTYGIVQRANYDPEKNIPCNDDWRICEAKWDEGVKESENTLTITIITSSIIFGVSRIAGLIFPFVYQKKYNRILDEALNLNNFAYSIDPLIVPRDGAPAVGLAFNIRY